MFRKKPTIGIDISDYSVEILRLDKSRKVLDYKRILLKKGTVCDGKILDKKVLSEEIKETLRTLNSGRFRAVLSLPESKIFIHRLILDSKLKGKDLEKQILETVRKIMPMGMEDVYWDYFSIQDKERQKVIYVGTEKETVDDYLEVMRLAGVEPVVLDIESVSSSRALLGAEAPISMLVDIGARYSVISIFDQKGILNLSVTVPQAGNYFTDSIAEKMKINQEEAEKIKRSSGLGEKSGAVAVAALQEGLQSIIREIKRAISFYEEQREGEIKEIILAGGSSLMPGLREYLEQELEKKVITGDPLKKIKNGRLFDAKHPEILFSNVIGLALRGACNLEAGINLIHRSPRPKKEFVRDVTLPKMKVFEASLVNKRLRTFSVLFPIFTIIFAGLIIYNYYRTASLRATYPDLSIFGTASIKINAEAEKPVKEKSPPEKDVGSVPAPESAPAEEENVPAETGANQPEESVPAVDLPSVASLSSVASAKDEAKDGAEEEPAMLKIKNTPTGWLNVRAGPGKNYAQTGRVYPQEEYIFLKEENGWYKIKIDDNKEGWIISSYAEMME